MSSTALSIDRPTAPHRPACLPVRFFGAGPDADVHPSRDVFDMLKLLSDRLAPRRLVVHAGDVIYEAGRRFDNLYVMNSGFFKLVTVSPDGREQVVGLKFRGDWLGFDGIAGGAYDCDAVAMDTGDVWVIGYEALLAACSTEPALLTILHRAMSREIGRDRESLL